MSEFTEVADRVWVSRYDWFDVNVTVVEGAAGLVVVDSHASHEAALGVLADLRRLSSRPLACLVNTHVHFDHTFGNGAFRDEFGELPIVAHEAAVESLPAHAEAVRREMAHSADERAAEVVATELVVPDRSFSSVTSIDLGDRSVDLVHPGRGHTSGDLVVRLDDADVLLAGDLVEESGMPSYGDDCYPMEWPTSLDLTLNLIGPETVVVPGHGAPVGLDFVQEQRSSIGVVAETIRDLAGRGVPLDEALSAAPWPYPSERLGDAVRRGYEQLPRSAKRLPLI